MVFLLPTSHCLEPLIVNACHRGLNLACFAFTPIDFLLGSSSLKSTLGSILNSSTHCKPGSIVTGKAISYSSPPPMLSFVGDIFSLNLQLWNSMGMRYNIASAILAVLVRFLTALYPHPPSHPQRKIGYAFLGRTLSERAQNGVLVWNDGPKKSYRVVFLNWASPENVSW